MKNALEGQMDIFEAMDRAAAAVDKMMEQDSGKKNRSKKRKVPEEINSGECVKDTAEGKKVIYGIDMHASMQKTFLNPADDDFATVAYIDYNMIYWKDWNAPAALRIFENSKEAVDFYVEKLTRLQEGGFAEAAREHEPFRDMKYVVENLYAECED